MATLSAAGRVLRNHRMLYGDLRNRQSYQQKNLPKHSPHGVLDANRSLFNFYEDVTNIAYQDRLADQLSRSAATEWFFGASATKAVRTLETQELLSNP